MYWRECLFKSWECHGERKRFEYVVPFLWWGWPNIYLCEFHKDCDFDYKDALNSRSNVKTNNKKMTRTDEFSPLQGMEFWMGINCCEEIEFCPACKGTGEIGDCEGNLNIVKLCEDCNCTGRKNMKNDTKGETLKETDVKVKPQVPGITTQKEKAMTESELMNQELFYRAIGR